MAKRDSMPTIKCTGLKQWILHPCCLFLHSHQGFPDNRGPHFAGTEVSDFLDLQQIEKGIAFRGGYQFGLFPSCQLTRREP